MRSQRDLKREWSSAHNKDVKKRTIPTSCDFRNEIPRQSQHLVIDPHGDIPERFPWAGLFVFTAFGSSRAPQCKIPPPQVHQVHFACGFMSLGYELVVFEKFIKFIKFIPALQICNSGSQVVKDRIRLPHWADRQAIPPGGSACIASVTSP
jgi:hypothetical protein